ncbi:DUF4268 domain-containing protein [Roseomonas sp. SSH11]|uniref:DUF4268 domain-containing protein n=1 Tax=Pararoseomonas baculiformis TaxID=2820812 RepID=A0ABS4AK73_9PROT|nr:DUF4268 domain-containing protein [Pararoseomonas baculiformis]MBP0447448.1 DUF4268 domain-containing protein [Pararoseomonas baculiformis]
MALYRVADQRLEAVPQTTFAEERILERRDLQRLLRSDASPLGEDLLVLAEEFSDWRDSGRRVDLLCLDRQARLVVVEIKRTDDGGHMELQALRYAAMVSSMTLEQAISTRARSMGGDGSRAQAEAEVLDFLGWSSVDQDELTDEVRIVLVAADFSTEITTSVLWLNKRGLDVTCVRLRPYKLGSELLIDAAQIIPLPEAADYEVKVREQAKETQKVRTVRQDTLRRFWTLFIESSKARTPLFSNRSPTTDHWLSAGIGRAGFNLNVSLTEDQSRAECWISIAKDAARSEAAFRLLEEQRGAIEQAFGGPLLWQDLPGRTGCRICAEVEGGWRSPEADWPALQGQLIDVISRLHAALKGPIQGIAA